jgi:HK97 family phage prohead protease
MTGKIEDLGAVKQRIRRDELAAELRQMEGKAATGTPEEHLALLEHSLTRLQTKLEAASAADDGRFVAVLNTGIEGKAVTSGKDCIYIEGQAAGFSLDRQGEAFAPGAFEAALGRYLRNGILVWNHELSKPLGEVEDARLDPARGLFIRARLDKPEPGTELADIYRKVASGTLKGLSVGGRFRREQTPQGIRIVECDLIEISVCAAPVERESLFTVAGKALADESVEKALQQLGEIIDVQERVVNAL